MSKSNIGNSNLYMTTREFADIVIAALEAQNYFKKNDVCHPQDIAYAFTTVGETIGTTMSWAIQQEHRNNKKDIVTKNKDFKKSDGVDDYNNMKLSNYVLGEDFVRNEVIPSEEVNRKKGYL